MVVVSSSTTKRRPPVSSRTSVFTCGGTVKPQTIVTVTIGLVVLWLFSLEPVIVYEPSSDSASSIQGRASQNPNPLGRLLPTRPARASPSRYGMVPKQSLRTSIIHPVDTLTIQKTSTDNSSAETRNIEIDNEAEEDLSNAEIKEGTRTSHPRVVSLGGIFDSTALSPTKTSLSSLVPIMPPDAEPIRFESMSLISKTNQKSNSTEIEIFPFERPFVEECEQKQNHQVHPTCNHLHELTMSDETTVLLNTKGSWRTAWTVHNDTAVLKVLQWARSFDKESYQHHSLDVIVSDLLTASPYVIDAYGYCGQSILQEWAPSGARDFVKSYDIRNRQRLKIARDLARGLADLQALERIPHDSFTDSTNLTSRDIPPSPPSVFSHNDINIANTIHVNGRIKWNDFNIGVLLRTRKGSNYTEDCGAPVKFRADLWRSPEEVRNTSYVQLQYTDMYGFGNLLYQVMTRHQPWTHKEPEGKLTVEQVADRKRLGRLPTIPEQYLNTTNKDLQTMLLATMSCYHPIPSKRLTAYELAHALSYVYDRLQHKKKVPTSMLRELFLSK